ncbi:MAG: MarR family transcriptional regulator [Bacteroidia bacterium]|nr:MarR family transcriptional regulator [Bacteroidia bacterium]
MNALDKVVLFQIDKTNKIAKIFSQREFDQKKLGITIDQWVLLKVIHENEGISQKDLAVISYRDPASITRTLSLLEKKGLIFRRVIPENKRQHEVFLSRTGKNFIDEHFPMVQRQRAQSLKGFTEQEIEQLCGMLKRMQKNLSE